MLMRIKRLGFTWETMDPFLFCVHHYDTYPQANDQMGPATSLTGRNLGQDFEARDGWRMYHGLRVPGFPMHPHRGFETVTVVLDGFVDHSDSHGAAGRYGNGDVQWMTAGSGLQHAEMFPLLNKKSGNPLHLFQIWLNLPGAKKFSEPHYKMLWADMIPTVLIRDSRGLETALTLIAGRLGDVKAAPPAPDSWAADPDNEVCIWIIKIPSDGHWTLPAATQPVNRTLFFYSGASIRIGESEIPAGNSIDLKADQDIILENGADEGHFLFLQGRPISEPVVQYGPFVMNTEAEIREAFDDYRRTQFGGWPWERNDPVHAETSGRFARYSDGREETRGSGIK